MVLLFWENDHRAGEHWDYLVLAYAMFFVSCAFLAVSGAGALVLTIRRKFSGFWWLAVLVTCTPVVLYLEIIP